MADGQLHPLIRRRGAAGQRHKGESRGPAKNPNWLEPLRRKRGAPSLHPSTPCQGSSAKKVVSCRVRFRFNPCKNQLRSTRGDLVRALLEVSEGFCYCNQTPNVPIPFCWESEVIYTLLNILRRSQELPSLCIPYICFCSSLRHHAAGNSSGGYRSGLGKKHSLYHPEITQSCPRQGLALCLSAYTAVFHPAPFVLCIWLCFSCATPTQEAEVKARSRAPEHSSAFFRARKDTSAPDPNRKAFPQTVACRCSVHSSALLGHAPITKGVRSSPIFLAAKRRRKKPNETQICRFLQRLCSKWTRRAASC